MMAPKITLSGPARMTLVADILTSLMRLQNDGGLSIMARVGLGMLTGWLAQEHARLSQKYGDTSNG